MSEKGQDSIPVHNSAFSFGICNRPRVVSVKRKHYIIIVCTPYRMCVHLFVWPTKLRVCNNLVCDFDYHTPLDTVTYLPSRGPVCSNIPLLFVTLPSDVPLFCYLYETKLRLGFV